MVSLWIKMKVLYWLKVGAYDQIDQFIMRERTYLAGEFCMYNEEQKKIYRAYLDRLEKRLNKARGEA